MPPFQLRNRATLFAKRIRGRITKGGVSERLFRRMVKVMQIVLPPPSSDPEYTAWIAAMESKRATQLQHFTHEPLISIVVPAYETPDKYLLPLIASVKAQTYKNWQLCIADGSKTIKRSDAIRRTAESDKRIVYQKLEKNLGIAGNTNAAIALATGQFIAFLDHDDTLAPFALAEIVMELQRHPKTDVFYSDEDKLSEDGTSRSLPFFKPDWSPDLFLGVNYLAHFVAVRADLVREVGGIRTGFDGAQDYDFLLRVTERKPSIRHIPKMLYHWRQADGSTAGGAGNKDYADSAGRRALTEYVQRNNISAEVIEIPERPTNYRVKYATTGQPLVSIIIPFKDGADTLRQCIESIQKKTTYTNYELVLVSNNSTKKETWKYLERLRNTPRIRQYSYDYPYNASAINNVGRAHAKGKLLLFLNPNIIGLDEQWLEELVGVALRPEVGIVGGLVLYPDGRVQHAGIVLGMCGLTGHPFRLRRLGEWTAFGMPDWPREYLAVTGACMMMRAEVFDQVGGFNETFVLTGGDSALGITVTKCGYQNVFWPYARVKLVASVSTVESKILPSDHKASLIHLQPYLEQGDPYFNPNLDVMSEFITIKIA